MNKSQAIAHSSSIIYVLIFTILILLNQCAAVYFSIIPLSIIAAMAIFSYFKPLIGGLLLASFGLLIFVLLCQTSLLISIIIGFPLIIIGILLILSNKKTPSISHKAQRRRSINAHSINHS